MTEVELQVEALEEVLVQLGERLLYVLWGVIQVVQLAPASYCGCVGMNRHMGELAVMGYQLTLQV